MLCCGVSLIWVPVFCAVCTCREIAILREDAEVRESGSADATSRLTKVSSALLGLLGVDRV
jgi:hypothetical protein